MSPHLPLVGTPADEESQSDSSPTAASEASRLEKIIDLMNRIDVFKDVPAEEVQELAASFTTRIVLDGEAIVRQGDPGHELFFIQEGSVSVRIKKEQDSAEIEVATLNYGQYFGEAALLTDAPRNASVYASGQDVMLSVLSRERFEELGLKNKLKLQLKHLEMDSGLGDAVRGIGTFRNLVKLVVSLGLFLGLSILIFNHFEGWTATDCVYFAIITLLTVGYGDIYPTHSVSRLFVIIFVVTALVVLAVIIGDFLETLVTAEINNEKARKALRLQQPRVGVFDQDGQKRRFGVKLGKCVLGIVLLLTVYILVAKYLLVGGEDFIDGLYFAIVTLTTIGYGDIVPKQPSSKWVVSLLSLIGVPLFAMLLAQIVDIVYGKARSEQIHTVVGGLTSEKFDHLIEFCDGMALAGAYNSKPRDSRREEITPFEFLCFILVQNETISMDDIKAIMGNFSELDINRSGKLDQSNLEEWQRRGAKNPACLAREASAKSLGSSRVRRASLTPGSVSLPVNLQAEQAGGVRFEGGLSPNSLRSDISLQ